MIGQEKLSIKKQKELIIKLISRIFINLYHTKKNYRKFFLFVIDSLLILLSIKIVIYFLYPASNVLLKGISTTKDYGEILPNNLLAIILILVVYLVYSLTGQYLSLSRYIKSTAIFGIAFRNFLVVSIFLLFKLLIESTIFDLRQFMLLWLVSTFMIVIFRFTVKEINIYLTSYKSQKISKVAIYGAGDAGAQLASSLTLIGRTKIVAFFDDNQNLWGRKLLGIPILSSQEIFSLKEEVDQVYLAIPSLSGAEAIKIVNRVQAYEIPVFKVPSIEELTSGRAEIDSLRPIEVEDLLGRGTVRPYKKLIQESINGLNICITGAGGSIGQELCRQVLNHSPTSVIMIDNSESNLYHLEQEILSRNFNSRDIRTQFILGNVSNYSFIKEIFEKKSVEIVFHAAAYKHVPLIEVNPLQGIDNNVFSTLTICKAALSSNIKKVTLISTDKAVRPSNIMGASKRLAELIFQAYAQRSHNLENLNSKKIIFPKFSIVRFGNVLNSSGSVVPLFKKQIAQGGPITLTNENVIRYFMTVPEAAQLVIQATTLSEGGEVFLLDMGSPIKIFDLAKQMIKLSGLKVKDSNNIDGDIEIITTGLRPGEKLYEELLIDAKSQPTNHPLIFKANESFLPYEELLNDLKDLEKYINEQNKKLVFKILAKLVPEWTLGKVSEEN